MPSLVKLPLPAGKIGVVFKGTPPTVTRLTEGSPMQGRIKEGYVFQALILNDGTSVEDLSTATLIETLKECSEEEGRTIVMKMALPDGTEIALPEGAIGATVQNINGKATITHIDSDSPLKHSLRIGFVVDKVMLEDGTELTGHSAEEVEVLLAEDVSSSGRRLALKNPVKGGLGVKKVTLPMIKTVNLPTGKLGVVFKGKDSKVSQIKEGSPMRGIFRVGHVVDSLTMPDGLVYRGYDSLALCKALAASANTTGRTMILKSPLAPDLPTCPTMKVPLPSMGNTDELGLTFEGATNAVIAQVKESSTFKGKLFKGQIVVEVNGGDGNTYIDLDATKVAAAILDCSGCAGRYMVVKAA